MDGFIPRRGNSGSLNAAGSPRVNIQPHWRGNRQTVRMQTSNRFWGIGSSPLARGTAAGLNFSETPRGSSPLAQEQPDIGPYNELISGSSPLAQGFLKRYSLLPSGSSPLGERNNYHPVSGFSACSSHWRENRLASAIANESGVGSSPLAREQLQLTVLTITVHPRWRRGTMNQVHFCRACAQFHPRWRGELERPAAVCQPSGAFSVRIAAGAGTAANAVLAPASPSRFNPRWRGN